MTLLMIAVVVILISTGIFLAGVGVSPYLSVDAILIATIAPVSIVLLGVPSKEFFRAFLVAFHPSGATESEVKDAKIVIAGTGRTIGLVATMFAIIGAIAMLVDPVGSLQDHFFNLSRGTATLLVSIWYAVVIRTIVIQPLIIRLDRSRAQK